MRALIAVVVSFAAIVAVPAAPAHAAASRCHTTDLSASLKAGSPGAGQRYATLTLRNRSKSTCTVYGYAGLGLLSSSGKSLPTRVTRNRSKAPKTITLKPGQHTNALAHWGAVAGAGEPTSGACEPTPKRVEVTPPDETTHLTIAWQLGPVCEKGAIELTPFGRTTL
jgi:Protein of unknown function (DUF4232)